MLKLLVAISFLLQYQALVYMHRFKLPQIPLDYTNVHSVRLTAELYMAELRETIKLSVKFKGQVVIILERLVLLRFISLHKEVLQ